MQNPLDGTRWWLKADYPWQCLAACHELTRALALPKPASYVSHLPVHQDGTCNGLQHYAALGGDEDGARAVNLLPADRPQDVYSGVAKLVAAKVEQDAKEGHPAALLMQGKLDRKIVKQTVMTSVYGVTFIGAREQIANRLKERSLVSPDDILPTSIYLTRLTFDALDKMFLGAKEIMEWLRDSAAKVASTGSAVTFYTPLGLPVIQPYRKGGPFNVRTVLQNILLVDSDQAPVYRSKQKSAFPPNYVHSLDSTHMLLTALECVDQNITFAAVHDSYWTHACSVPLMSHTLRREFVRLHKQPLLEQLQAQFKARHPGLHFRPLPALGKFDLERVMDSKYFFN